MSGQHCLLAEGDIDAPIFTSVSSSVRLTYFQTNRLLNELYKQETEIRWRKDDGYIKKQTDIDRHSTVSPSTSSQPLDPPNLSLPTTFKGSPLVHNYKYSTVYARSFPHVEIFREFVGRFHDFLRFLGDNDTAESLDHRSRRNSPMSAKLR